MPKRVRVDQLRVENCSAAVELEERRWAEPSVELGTSPATRCMACPLLCYMVDQRVNKQRKRVVSENFHGDP